jgi:hypothetical protein
MACRRAALFAARLCPVRSVIDRNAIDWQPRVRAEEQRHWLAGRRVARADLAAVRQAVVQGSPAAACICGQGGREEEVAIGVRHSPSPRSAFYGITARNPLARE